MSVLTQITGRQTLSVTTVFLCMMEVQMHAETLIQLYSRRIIFVVHVVVVVHTDMEPSSSRKKNGMSCLCE